MSCLCLAENIYIGQKQRFAPADLLTLRKALMFALLWWSVVGCGQYAQKKKRLSPIEGFPSCNCNFYPSFLFFLFCFGLGWVGLGFFDWSLNYSQLLCLSGLWLKDWSSGLHTTPHVLLLVLFVTLEARLYIIQEGRNQENMLFDVHVQITVLPHYCASFPQTVSRCKKHIGLHIREAY